MNGEAMSVDLGPITEPKMAIGFDKDNDIVTTVSFKVKADPRDIAGLFSVGKTIKLRARIFTEALPVLPDSEGEQLGLGSVPPTEPDGADDAS